MNFIISFKSIRLVPNFYNLQTNQITRITKKYGTEIYRRRKSQQSILRNEAPRGRLFLGQNLHELRQAPPMELDDPAHQFRAVRLYSRAYEGVLRGRET